MGLKVRQETFHGIGILDKIVGATIDPIGEDSYGEVFGLEVVDWG